MDFLEPKEKLIDDREIFKELYEKSDQELLAYALNAQRIILSRMKNK